MLGLPPRTVQALLDQALVLAGLLEVLGVDRLELSRAEDLRGALQELLGLGLYGVGVGEVLRELLGEIVGILGGQRGLVSGCVFANISRASRRGPPGGRG